MKRASWSNRRWGMAVAILILLIVGVVHCYFISQKEGYHLDEILSFEMSNAEYNPWIVPTQPVGRLAKFMHEEVDGEDIADTVSNVVVIVEDVIKNRGNSKLLTYKADVYEEPTWITAKQMQDYLVTDKGDCFSYLSVYFNVKDDTHPIFFFMLLHTVSSFFPPTFAPFIGCVINLFFVLLTCALLIRVPVYLEDKGILKNNGFVWGAVAALLYGLSSGAFATTLLIRMYGMLTFWCVLTLYLHLRKWIEEEFHKKNKILIAVTVAGFLTQYFFLFYCIVLAIVSCVLLWRRKRTKELICYIRTMLFSAVLGIVMFPFCFSHILAGDRGVGAFQSLIGGLGEYLQRIIVFGEILLSRSFGDLLLGIAACVLLVAAVVMSVRKGDWKGNGATISLMVVPAGCYFFLTAKMAPFYVDRYIMVLFPFCMLALAYALLKVCEKREVIAVAVAACICVFNVVMYDGEYLYRGYEQQLQIAEEYGKYPCICLYEGYGYYENIPEFMNYTETLLVTPDELLGRRAQDVEELTEVVLMIKAGINEDKLRACLEKYNWKISEELISSGAHGEQIVFCTAKGL